MNKNKGAGRGLDAIFIDNFEQDTGKNEKGATLRLSEIEPDPSQPRTHFDREALEELASSIAEHGLLQPIIVRKNGNGYYRIIAGERRWRASKMAGLTEIPVIIAEADDRKAAEISLIENLQREDLNAVEEAAAYKALIEEYDLTQEEVSSRIGKSRSAVANSVRLLDLPDEVLEFVRKDRLSAGHARAILGLNDRSSMGEIAKETAEKGLSVRATEELVRQTNKKKTRPAAEKKQSGIEVDYIADLEKRVTAQTGRLFKIRASGKRKKIEIEFTDENDLEEIIKKFCGKGFFEE